MGRKQDCRRGPSEGRLPPCQASPAVPRLSLPGSSPFPFVWPLLATASLFNGFARNLIGHAAGEPRLQPGWETPHAVTLELVTLRLRDFSAGEAGQPTLICAPFALHGASVANFAPGHSLVAALRAAGVRRLVATEWRSATREMRFLTIDSYLADLNVVVDDFGAPVDLIGLCQGGWLALVYAARFPHKVRRLVLAGAPIDLDAASSALSTLAADVPIERFEEIVDLGEGRVLSDRVLDLWGRALGAHEADDVLQVPPACPAAKRRDLEARFNDWYAWTVDLPGAYYLQTVSWIFKKNRIARGTFVALGRTIDLAALRAPMFLLAGRDDAIVAPPQLLSAAALVGTPKHQIETAVEPCGHLGLFMGARTLRSTWPRIARWLTRDVDLAQAG